MLIKRKDKMSEEDRTRKLAKEREKQRKKMIRTRYGQKQKKHARKGIQSCLLAAFSVISLFLMIFSSFQTKGDVSLLVGFFGLFTLVIAWKGVSYAIHGFKERDKNYITCKVGAGCNGVILLAMLGLFIRGLF